MKYIKRFDDTKKVNEEFGGLELVALTFGAMVGVPALLNYASATWQKFMMEKKYVPTGKVEKCEIVDDQEKVGGQPGEKKYLEFQELKDKTTGELYYGTELREGAGVTDEQQNLMFLLYTKENFEKIKNDLMKDSTVGRVLLKHTAKASWSKTPQHS